MGAAGTTESWRPGFRYNLTDIAAAIGLHQLERAEEMRQARERLARSCLAALGGVEEIKTPPDPPDRIHAWHPFPARLQLERLALDRNRFMEALKKAAVGALFTSIPTPRRSLAGGEPTCRSPRHSGPVS